jgi:threonine/homoserine/homoserine lactone efflux protein
MACRPPTRCSPPRRRSSRRSATPAPHTCAGSASTRCARARPTFRAASPAPRSPWRSYRQGALVELGNPKVALFFLALFPQFIHPDAGPAATQVLILGTIFASLGFASDSLYALGSGRLRELLNRRPKLRRRQHRATGLLYLGLGGWAAT